MKQLICPICKTKLTQQKTSWHYSCPACLYERSVLLSKINSNIDFILDENQREKGLFEVRNRNFDILIKKLLTYRRNNSTLLDVGSAHGWFLERASKFFNILGIEPDKLIYNETTKQKQDIPMYCGFFPTILSPNEKFDIITFNDVFEHIDDAEKILNDCEKHLNKDGILLINLPLSTGIFYRVSKLLARFKVHSYFERMWQKDMPSPHIHYFNLSNLSRLLENNGFAQVETGYLSAINLQGLSSRLRFDNKRSKLNFYLICSIIFVSYPFLNLLPKDIGYIIAKKL